MIRSSFEQRASSIIGSMTRSPAGVRRDWTMTAPFISTADLPADRREWLGRSCKAALSAGAGAAISPLAAHVELENAGNHDHGLRPIPVLEHRELHRLGTVHEHATAK